MSHAPYYDGRQCSAFLSFDHRWNYITALIAFHMNHTQQDETRFASFTRYRDIRQGFMQAWLCFIIRVNNKNSCGATASQLFFIS